MNGVDPFEVFVRTYQDMVFATAVRLLGSRTEAEDVAQTVFLKAFERFDDIVASPTAPGWLRTVTTNHCLNHLTRYRRRWRLFSEMNAAGGSDDDTTFEASVAAPVSDGHPLDDRERDAALEAALLRLPDHQRVPLVLFHFEEQSYQAIASALGVSLGKIKTDIHRGREALRRYLTEGEHGPR